MARKKINRKPRILVLEGLRDAATCVRMAGGAAITVNPRNLTGMEEAMLLGVDGLLLTGGGDVDPRLYGEKPHPKVYGVSEPRDAVEWNALDAAKDFDLPVMGICRGMQMIAIHNGGRMRQHLPGHRNTVHLVLAERGSDFSRVIGQHAGMFVSLHHQVVLRHGYGFRVAARCRQGNIEAIESKDGRVLGVQFHPEMDAYRNVHSRRLFEWLVKEAAKRSGLVTPRPTVTTARTSKSRKPRKRDQLTLLPGDKGTTSTTPAKARPPRKRKPVAISRWFCRQCGLEFDKQLDRDDHEYWICGVGMPTMRTTEPPPGHPDWLDEDDLTADDPLRG